MDTTSFAAKDRFELLLVCLEHLLGRPATADDMANLILSGKKPSEWANEVKSQPSPVSNVVVADHGHRVVQHRDNKELWCELWHLNGEYKRPRPLFAPQDNDFGVAGGR